jgi:hypothetical protein
MSRRLLSAVAAATTAAAATALVVLAAPAGAHPAAAHPDRSATDSSALRFTPPRIGSTLHRGTLVRKHGFNQDGGNWSGYAARGSGFTSVTSSWVEPSVRCNSTDDLFAPWVGIDGYGSATVEQTGVATDCSSGRPVYQGWYEMYPAAPVYYSNPAAAGDHITATVTRSGLNYTLTLSDTTQGWTKTTTKTLTATNSSVEVIMESPTAAYPDFGAVNFTGSRVNGGTLGATNPVALDASNSYGFEDHTSALSGGTDFSITYEQE